MKRSIPTALLALALAVLLLAPMRALAADFTDTQDHWAESSINRWSEAGVVNGVGDGLFDPDGNMSRAAVAQVLHNLLRLEEAADISGFSDVDADAWYADAVAMCVAAGILKGTGADTMEPMRPINRQEFYVMTARAFGIGEQSAAGRNFPDSEDVSAWAGGYINALDNLGIFIGDGDRMAPQDNVTRADIMAALDCMVAEYITEDGGADAALNGITVIAAKNVALTGGGGDFPIVVAADGAYIDLAGAGTGVEITVLGTDVELINVPDGTTVTAQGCASGLTVNGEALAAGETLALKLTSISYGGEEITLSEKALYVDQSLPEEQLGDYVFNTLQDCVAAAEGGTRDEPTVIYMAPGVYWTDDYTDPALRDSDSGLVGLTISQPYITMIGVTGDRDDVVIASDRGQNAGANGNFNTLGISDGFHAKDITFGNYCNVDLVYERNPYKSHEKRQGAIVQAQVITKAGGVEEMDEWFFEGCSFVSRLNVFSNSLLPDRTLYVDCHFESTDDSIGTGYVSVFLNCDFDFYSSTPSGSASEFLQAYLNCEFRMHLADEGVLNLSKHSNYFVILDTDVTGNITGVEWKNGTVFHDTRSIVSGNTLNGEPLTITASAPEYSVTPEGELLNAFKVGDEYNVYNLLNSLSWYRLSVGRNGDPPRSRTEAELPEWDPLNQKEALGQYAAPWGIRVYDPDGVWDENADPVLMGDGTEQLILAPVVLGNGAAEDLTWTCDSDAVKLDKQEDGAVVITAVNYTYEDICALVTATAENGLSQVLHVNVISPTLEAPQVKEGASLSIADGTVTLTYSISDIPDILVDGESVSIDPELNPDCSVIEWYRDGVIVATTTYVLDGSKPNAAYTLSSADIGSTITAVITPKYLHSEAGESVSVTAGRAVTAEDVTADDSSMSVDFSTLAYNVVPNGTTEEDFEWDTSDFRSGAWYGGFYLPAEYREGGVFESKRFSFVPGEDAWTFDRDSVNKAPGLQTTTQGARLMYVDDAARGDMTMTVTMTPHKTAGQGFGSGYQFMDIYFKYDAKTMNGYGLRITREGAADDPLYSDYLGKSCSFQLIEYVNGAATPVSEKVYSSAFNPVCTVVLTMEGNTLTAAVTTTKAQGSDYPEYLKNDVSLTHTFEEANTFGGVGFQHTGTAGEGKSGNRTTIHTLEVQHS